jgi:glutamate racemase
VGESIAVIDSASATASALASLLEVHDLATPHGTPGSHTLLTSGPEAVFRDATTRIFGRDFGTVHQLEVDAAPLTVGSPA